MNLHSYTSSENSSGESGFESIKEPEEKPPVVSEIDGKDADESSEEATREKQEFSNVKFDESTSSKLLEIAQLKKEHDDLSTKTSKTSNDDKDQTKKFAMEWKNKAIASLLERRKKIIRRKEQIVFEEI